MNEIMREYAEYLEQHELAEGTKSIYLREAERFLEFAEGKEITKKLAIEHKGLKNQSELKNSTINLHLVAVNKFLKYMEKKDCCTKLNRVQRNHSVSNVISKREYKLLCDYALESGRVKYYYIMRILAGTGIRISELEYFTVESVRNGILTVRNKGKNREIYIPDALVKELCEYGKSVGITSGVIFQGAKGKPISRNAVFKMLKRLANMTDVPQKKVYPHSFRHLFALTYMEKYHNLSELADILGHSSLETTRIYLLESAEQKQSKISALGLLDL